jgi:hypothetical protein
VEVVLALVPGVGHVLGDLRFVQGHGIGDVPVLDDSLRKEGGVPVVVEGEPAVTEIIGNPGADSRRALVLVIGGGDQHVGKKGRLHEMVHFLQPEEVFADPAGVEGIHDGADAAHHEGLGVGVLSAEDGLHLRRRLGELEGIQVVGGDDQVRFRGKLEGRVSPVGVGEGAEPSEATNRFSRSWTAR